LKEADMKNSRLAGFVVVLFLLLVFGCNNPTGTDVSLDEEAIQDYISSSLDFAGYFAFDEYYGEEDTVPAVRTITGPSIWYREPQDTNRDILINIVNDSAFVSFWSNVDGVFHILEIDTSASPDTLIDHQKNLDDNSSNYAIFKRAFGATAYRGWRLESLTGVDINGLDRQKGDCVVVWIDSIRINCESYEDTLFTTPFVFFGREELLTFRSQEAVTLTLYSNYDIYSYLHAHSLGHWRRWKFAEIEAGVWQGYWVTPIISGIRVIAFDILRKPTIDEEDSPYESNIWLFPYRVK
jgi:hypothetical protein